MKKISLLSFLIFGVIAVNAQNYDLARNALLISQLKKAKEEVDKGMTNAKYASKPEAYILKSTIYAALATDSAIRASGQSEQYLKEAEDAYNKYKEMQPDLSLLTKDPTYHNGPINIYVAMFSAGYKDYDTKDWQAASDKFKKVVEYSDFLIDKKFIPVTVDTNSLLLAGITSESAGKKDDAAKYYTRLADMQIGGSSYEGIYRFLVNYYFTNKDIEKFEKYKKTGAQLYPNSEFFGYDKIDFVVGLEEDLNKRVTALEQAIASDPANHKAIILLGEIIYDTLNSRREGAVVPSNFAELETKMVASFEKAAQLKEEELPYLYIGDHYINQSIKINDEREAHAADMKKRTKPGAASSKEDLAKRDALDVRYMKTLESALIPYEKAAALFAKKGELAGSERGQYRKVSGYLAEIYMLKKNKAKAGTPDKTKFGAEEEKWNKVYDSIKN
jgi:hypothetical protein